MVEQVVRTLLDSIGIRGGFGIALTEEGYLVEVRSRSAGRALAGRRGSILRAIQHVALMIVRRAHPGAPPILVDVGGYRARRGSFLCRKALAVARIVVETGREMALETLSEHEMAVVRAGLRSVPEVRVHAVGTGPRRVVVIAPAGQSQPEPRETGGRSVPPGT